MVYMSETISHDTALVSVAAIMAACEAVAPQAIEINHFGGTLFILILSKQLGFINTLCVSESIEEIEDDILYQMQICFPSQGTVTTEGFKNT